MSAMWIFELWIDFMFIIDIFINFRTGYYEVWKHTHTHTNSLLPLSYAHKRTPHVSAWTVSDSTLIPHTCLNTRTHTA